LYGCFLGGERLHLLDQHVAVERAILGAEVRAAGFLEEVTVLLTFGTAFNVVVIRGRE
jgi:hypothetical protein